MLPKFKIGQIVCGKRYDVEYFMSIYSVNKMDGKFYYNKDFGDSFSYSFPEDNLRLLTEEEKNIYCSGKLIEKESMLYKVLSGLSDFINEGIYPSMGKVAEYIGKKNSIKSVQISINKLETLGMIKRNGKEITLTELGKTNLA